MKIKLKCLLKLLMFSSLAFGFSTLTLSGTERGEKSSYRDVERVRNLADDISRNIRFADVTRADLREMEDLLERAVRIMRDGGGSDDVYQECVDYAFEAYNQSMSSARALDRAQSECRGVVDMDILKFIFEAKSRGFTSAQAMDRATSLAIRGVEGKLKLLEFAYDKFNRGLTSAQAASRAASGIVDVFLSRGTLSCFERNYDIYSRTYSSVQAMDRTLDSCKNVR